MQGRRWAAGGTAAGRTVAALQEKRQAGPSLSSRGAATGRAVAELQESSERGRRSATRGAAAGRAVAVPPEVAGRIAVELEEEQQQAGALPRCKRSGRRGSH